MTTATDDALLFADEPATPDAEISQETWKVMIVDDEADVHHITNFAFSDYEIDGKKIETINAYSGTEAMQMIEAHPDTAIILLDVIMETPNAGLEVVAHIRNVLKNHDVRIILRTGQPNKMVERDIFLNYEINDFKTKNELTADRLFTAVLSALRSYQQIVTLKIMNQQTIKANNQKTQAEMESAAKTAYVTNVNHELRTPINAIIGYSEILLEDLDSATPENLGADIHHILVAAKQQLNLINNILDIAKIEAGKTELYVSEFNINKILEEVKTTTYPLAKHNHNKLIMAAHPDLPMMTNDEAKLRQCLLNLVSNACKFTKNGTITVSAKILTDKDWIEFNVQDDGIGINKLDLEKLFQPFTQANASINTQFGGTGLGLLLCHRFSNLMHGTIQVASERDQGTCFTLQFPLHITS